MERRLGSDLGAVRVHTGARAARTADALDAYAFSIGPDVGFAAGAYAPASSVGRGLIAHELAHTLQPSEPAGLAGDVSPEVRRQPIGSSGGAASSLPAVDLLGHGRFEPPQAIADHIRGRMGDDVYVPVTIGTWAHGILPVRWSSGRWLSTSEDFQTPEPPAHYPGWALELTHPAFLTHPLARPKMWITIVDAVVGGSMGWESPVGLSSHPARFRQQVPREKLFNGMSDFTDLELRGEMRDSFWDGHLVFSVPDLSFTSGPFHGTGRMSVVDDSYAVDAHVPVPVPGLAGADLPVKADEHTDGSVFATRTWTYSRDLGAGRGRLAGSLTGTLGRGLLDVRGSVRYVHTDPAVTGAVTIVVTRTDLAHEAVRDWLGQDAPPPTPALGQDLAITGYGEVDFALSPWLTGRAAVVVHPEGYVSARGELSPTAVVALTRMFEKKKQLPAPLSDKATIPVDGLPPLADVSVVLEWKTFVDGSIGPATLHDIRITGLVSTHPAIVNRFDLAGVISGPAQAGVHLWVSARLAGRLATAELVSAGVSGTGDVELITYAEAGAQAGRRAKAGTSTPEYYLQGHVEATASLLLRLGLDLEGSALFWGGKYHLWDRQWQLGQAGARLGFEYVLGGRGAQNLLTTSFTSLSFDPAKFAEALVRRDMVAARGKQEPTQVDSATGADSTDPAAPPPPELPSGTTPPSGGAGGSLTTRLDEPLEMSHVPHTLHLDLTSPPDLVMSSADPRRLLNKVKRARTDLRKVQPPTPATTTQMADLGKIEQETIAVLAAADKVTPDHKYVTPAVPGFRQLRQLIEDYGTRYHVTDLVATLGQVSVDPSDPQTVLNKFPGLAGDQLMVARVARILQSGVDVQRLRRIVDRHAPREEKLLVDLLEYIETMRVHGVQGWQTMISDLSIGGNKLKGARFVLTYVNRVDGWADLALETRDEEDAEPNSRRWDAWMFGRLYEFKAWYSWLPVSDGKFLKQIIEDYRKTRVGQDMPLRWVFGETTMKKADILDHMGLALDKVRVDLKAGKQSTPAGFTPKVVDFIEARLPEIVRVV